MMSRWGYFRTSLSSSCWLSHIHNNNRHLSQGYNSSSSADYTQVFDGPVIESAVSLLSWESFISCYWFVLLGHCIRLPHSGFFFDCICDFSSKKTGWYFVWFDFAVRRIHERDVEKTTGIIPGREFQRRQAKS